MAGKNQPPGKRRVIVMVPRSKASSIARIREKKREATTRRVVVPRR